MFSHFLLLDFQNFLNENVKNWCVLNIRCFLKLVAVSRSSKNNKNILCFAHFRYRCHFCLSLPSLFHVYLCFLGVPYLWHRSHFFLSLLSHSLCLMSMISWSAMGTHHQPRLAMGSHGQAWSAKVSQSQPKPAPKT